MLGNEVGFKPFYQPRGNITWCQKWDIEHFHKKNNDNNDWIVRNSPTDHRLGQFDFARSMETIWTACESDFHRSPERKAEEEKVSYLLLWVGDKGRDIYNTFPAFSAEEKKKLKPHLDKFQSHVQPKLNPIYLWYKFNNEVQGSSTFDQFVTQLKLLARDCNFKYTDDMIRDRIVLGI